MQLHSPEILDAIALQMGNSFMADPMFSAQMEGISQREKLLKAHARLSLKHSRKIGALHMLNNDPRAIMLAFDSQKNSKLREMITLVKTIGISFFILGFKDVRQFFRNMKPLNKILNFTWHKEFIRGRHYRVKVISIDKSLRGAGVFRRLFTPALEYADREGIPMVLETHNPSNVGLYEHFGFELVKTITSPETPVQQYCMIRKPVEPQT